MPPPLPRRRRLTSFVGRAEELDRLGELITDRRLVTLLGTGGAGKTRLARELTDRLADAGSRVLFVELASLTDPNELAATVLAVAGARESRLLRTPLDMVTLDRQDGIERLVAVLQDRPAVLVLDNCEHLLAACAELAEIALEHCPQLRILTTSREALAVPGETVCPVTSLPPPVALELFVDRAVQARPDLDLDPSATAAAVEICRRLDGLPLAIELAAARLRTMPLPEIAARLDDRFRLLTGGSRTALPRHRTLFAVVDWSWALLDEPERRLLEELSVFAGGFDLPAVESVHGPADAFDLLLELAEKSLIVAQDAVPGRYRTLETIREFGRDRLAGRADLAQIRLAHANHYARLALDLGPLLAGHGQIEALAQLKLERDNIFAALTQLAQVGDASRAVTLAITMAWSSFLLGSRTSGVAWLQAVLDASSRLTPLERASVGTFLTICELMSDNQLADLQRLDDSYADMAAVPLSEHPPLVLMIMVTARMFLVRIAPAGPASGEDPEMERLLTFGLAGDDPWLHATMLLVRANLWENAGQMTQALTATRAALEEFLVVGDRWGIGGAREILGRLLVYADPEEALVAMETAHRTMMELGATEDAANSRLWTALIQIRLQDFAGATASVAELERDWLGQGGPESDAMVAYLSTEILRVRALRSGAVPTEALRRSQVSVDWSGEPVPQLVTLGAVQRALLLVAAGDLPAARQTLGRAGTAAEMMTDMPITAGLGVALAALALAEQQPERAAMLLGAAEAVRGAADPSSPDEQRLRAGIVIGIGESAYAAACSAGRELGRPAALALLISETRQEGTDSVPS